MQLVTLGSQWRLEPNDPSTELLRGLTAKFWINHFPDEVARYNKSNPKPDLSRLLDSVKNMWLDISCTGYPNDQVTQIKCPIFVMRGDNDFLFSLSEAHTLIDRLANASFMNIPFTQHEAHKEYPELVGLAINRFLSNS